MIAVINFISVIILIYFAVLWVGYTTLLLGTFLSIVRNYTQSEHNNIIATLDENTLLPITVIIPAFNETKRIGNAIAAIYNSNYKNVHLIIVNDGSTDETLEFLIGNYALKKMPASFHKKIQTGKVHAYYQSSSIPNFIVIDKEHSPYANSGADCINAGLNVCRTPVFLTIDADTILEPKALSQMLFMYFSHPHCVAVGGDIYVPDTTQRKDNKPLVSSIPFDFVLGVQICEYLRSFLYGREGWSLLGGALCHPGALSMLETQAVLDVGGYDSSNFSYDAEIILKLHHELRRKKKPYSVAYAPSAIGWSETPKTVKQLWDQRNKWQRGLLRCLSRHKGMLFNPAYGITGMLAFPYYIFFEIFGPVVEGISYLLFIVVIFFDAIPLLDLAWLYLLAWGYITAVTMACVVLSLITYNKYPTKLDTLRILALTTIDMLFYRQVRAICALVSSVEYVVNRMRGMPQ